MSCLSQAFSAQMLTLPGVARALDLDPPAFGHWRAIGPLPPVCTLTMSCLRFHGPGRLLIVDRPVKTKADAFCDANE